MQDIFKHARRLGVQERTDAGIAQALNAVTRKAVPVSVLRDLLRKRGLCYRDSVNNGALAGTLADEARKANPSPVLVLFLNHIWDDQMQTVATHEVEFGEAGASLLSQLEAAALIDADVVSLFYQAGGGKLFPAAVTVEAVTAARAADALDETLRQVKAVNDLAYEAAAAAKREEGATADSILVAAKGVWHAQ